MAAHRGLCWTITPNLRHLDFPNSCCPRCSRDSYVQRNIRSRLHIVDIHMIAVVFATNCRWIGAHSSGYVHCKFVATRPVCCCCGTKAKVKVDEVKPHKADIFHWFEGIFDGRGSSWCGINCWITVIFNNSCIVAYSSSGF